MEMCQRCGRALIIPEGSKRFRGYCNACDKIVFVEEYTKKEDLDERRHGRDNAGVLAEGR